MSDSQVLAEYRVLESLLVKRMTPALTEEAFSELAFAILEFQQRWNPPLQAFLANRPTPGSWREIPAVPQAAFKRAVLSCVPPDSAKTVFQTSGTTGETRGRHYFLNARLYDTAILRGWDLLRLPKARALILAHHPKDAPHSSLSHMLGVLAGQRSVDGARWFISQQGQLDVRGFRDAIVQASGEEVPVAIFGTALAFLHLFEQLNGETLVLPTGSYAMETGGFKGSGRELAKADLYSMFTESLGLNTEDVFNEYGMTELSSQFYTRGIGGVHRAPPWLKALVIDPETGTEVAPDEIGILRIIDLANLNSAIAIETQDLAVRRIDGFELLGRDPAALPRGCSRAVDELLRR